MTTPLAVVPNELPFVVSRWRWLRKNPTLILGALLLLVVALITLAAPWIATHDPQDMFEQFATLH